MTGRPYALLVYTRGNLVVAMRCRGGYRLPDGTVLRWLAW